MLSEWFSAVHQEGRQAVKELCTSQQWGWRVKIRFMCMSSLGPTVFCVRRNLAVAAEFPSRNFTEFHVNTEIPRQRPNYVSLYCCCKCDTQSLQTATQACWFQWRVFTFSLLTYLSFYLLDFCRWRWPVISMIDWWMMTDIIIWLTWLMWWYHIIYHWYHSVNDMTDYIKIWNLQLSFNARFYRYSWIKIEQFSLWYHVTVLTFVIRITVFVKKREKLIPIILYIYAAVHSCSATFYYLKL